MTLSELKELISRKEGSKLDFKRQWYKKEELKTELIKDVIALANGNIHTIGEDSYLIVGVKERPDINEIYGVELERSCDDIKSQLLQNLQNNATPAIHDLEIEELTIESKNVMVITIPFHPYLIMLQKKLMHHEENTLLYRVGEATSVADTATRQEFEDALKKYLQKTDNSTRETVLFQKWNDTQAKNIVLDEISKYERVEDNNFGFGKTEPIVHQIQYYLELEDANQLKKVCVISTAPEGHDCHACTVKLSFVEFGKVSAGWILGEISIDAIEEGSWGRPPGDIGILSIGYNKFGIQIRSSYGNQGNFSDYVSIYTSIVGKYRSIFFEEISQDNSAGQGEENLDYYVSWDSSISFKKEGLSYYEMILLKKGIRDEKNFEEKNTYKFDGVKYVGV